MTGYCPNCGGAIEHDGVNAECERCSIEWKGIVPLKPEPYEPGELEALHARQVRQFEERNAPSV